MSAEEFGEWIAYAKLEPFGPLRDDHRAGVLAATVANSRTFRPKGEKLRVPADFFPPAQGLEPKPKQTWQQQYSILKDWTAALKGATRG